MSTTKVRLPIMQKSRAPAVLDSLLSLPEIPRLAADAPRPGRPTVAGATYRTSSYTIYVDLPGNDEDMLLTHTYTGAYDQVSRIVATYLRSHEARHAPKPLYGDWSPEPTVDGHVLVPSPETITLLKRRGYLTNLSVPEEEEYFASVASRMHVVARRQRPQYILMPTYGCNLRCDYCFQDHMRTDPEYAHLLRTMTPEMFDAIHEGMARIEAAHGFTPEMNAQRNITLFGGEPLLAESRPIIEHILRRSAERGNVRFTAVSNGTDLHAYRELLGPEKIAAIQITLDGPPEEHDKRRVYADRSGSFERIANNVSMALELGVEISVRMNVDRRNTPNLPALADEFVRWGWTEHPGFSCYVATVHAANDNIAEGDTMNTWDLAQIMRELTKTYPVLRIMGDQDDGLMRQARQLFDSRNDPLPHFKPSFCGAHVGEYVIDPFGDIYACWERTGDPSTRIGAIGPDGDVRMNAAITALWRSRNVASNAACRQCRYASYCGGGCAVRGEEQHGTPFANHCDGFAKRFRATMAKAYLDHVGGIAPEHRGTRVCDQ
jgi:uncharacterized protein